MTTSSTVIIGGITGGIGSNLASSLHAKGYRVAGYARSIDALETLNKELPGIITSPCDATDPEQVETVIERLNRELGSIDHYAHAIGSILLKPAHLTSDTDWSNVLNTNLNSAFYALRSVTKRMNKQSSGNCLFFSTAAAQTGIANHEAIAAAKGGIDALVRSAAASYCSRGIRVNAIAPSLTDTPLAKTVISSEQALKFSQKMHPLGTIGKTADVTSLAEWLLSDKAGFVTGQTFVIDGGLSTIVPKPKA